MRRRNTVLLLLSCLYVAACKDDLPNEAIDELPFECEIKMVFVEKCTPKQGSTGGYERDTLHAKKARGKTNEEACAKARSKFEPLDPLVEQAHIEMCNDHHAGDYTWEWVEE